MPTIHAFHVTPNLPESLAGLHTLAYNLRWAWNPETIELFRRLDRKLWEESGHNPVRMLGSISQDRLKEASEDEAFLNQLQRATRDDFAYMTAEKTWFRTRHAQALAEGARVAYFSMEFGLTECLPIYSGGLGVLAGDHLKSSSDLDIPLTAVGLLYQQGYFRQYLNNDCWQQERYPENDFYQMPLQMALATNGEPLTVAVEFPGRTVYAQVWKVQVGRIPLYLLDTNIAPNSVADQNITDQLYGGDNEMRLKQEMILGIGGMRALSALGIEPTLCHMNEGHSAFLALERVRLLMEKKSVDFETAREAAAAGSLFTTHTPVPAGFDVFPPDLLRSYFEPYVQRLGISFDDFLALGRINRYDGSEKFNMAILALHNSHQCNGVSALHGEVTRKMLRSFYPNLSEKEIPVGHVTNGIHIRSFLSQEMVDLFDLYLGLRWSQEMSDPNVWSKLEDIPDSDLWRVRERRRERLVDFVRERLQQQLERRGMSELDVRQAQDVLNPHVLTIGFARRFATYKRATLLLRDEQRLIRLLNDPQRPIQIVIAGKAHPKDDGGKELIRHIAQFARRPEVRPRFVFVEDYDIVVARHLVQGVDVWLNTPRRPMEASGTSGMKVLANGGLNLSVLDGWWAEGYDPRTGWAIGRGEEYNDPEYQDQIEANLLYDLLEKEIAPLFYDRTATGTPHAWMTRMRNSMRLLCPIFNTHRMVAEYAEKFYIPASNRFQTLSEEGFIRAKALVTWRRKIETNWGAIRVERVETPRALAGGELRVGAKLAVVADVRLGGLNPKEVSVQAYYGTLDGAHHIAEGKTLNLVWEGHTGDTNRFVGEIACLTTGIQGLSIRVVPYHEDAKLPIELPLMTWE